MGIDARTQELQVRLDAVRERINRACDSCDRDPAEVTLIVVTKTWPVEDVRRLASLGVRDLGENRDQEASPKADATRDLGVRWHFVGQLQSNKAASVARYADLVHSVDRPSLVTALGRGAAKAGRRVACLLEVDLTEGARGRGGVAPDDVMALAAEVAGVDDLDLRGVMGVAPLAGDDQDQRRVSAAAFERLRGIADDVQRAYPGADLMSAGMSQDLEEAIRAGATHLRVGSAVLGTRPFLG
jgi:PLP dependent protein